MSFRRPVGAQADVKELEYISALHQTCVPKVRENGTVSSLDILRFLKSRIGLEVDHSVCLRIVRGLGGGVLGDEAIEKILDSVETEPVSSPEEAVRKERIGVFRKLRGKKGKDVEAQEDDKKEEGLKDEDDDIVEEYLDMVQLLAALLIPTLARAGKEWREEYAVGEMKNDDSQGEGQTEEGLLAKLDARDQARRAEKDREVYESLRPKPESLLQDSLIVLLQSAPKDESDTKTAPDFPLVTPAFVEGLLEAHGEFERASDPKLVEQMVQAASSPSGKLDEEAFVNALTSDLSPYPIESEDRLTTMFYDVFGFESLREREQNLAEAATVQEDSSQTKNDSQSEDNPQQLQLTRMMASIDFSTDTHSSSVLTIGSWVFFVFTVILYASLFQSMEALDPKCDSSTFSCQISSTIVVWMVFAGIFVVVGYIMIIPLSVGNNARRRSPWSTMFSFVLSGIYTWIPYAAITIYRERSEKPYNGTEEAVEGRYFDNSMNLILAIGCLLSVLFFHQFVLSMLGNRRIRNSRVLNRLFATSAVRGVARTKKAATRKVNAMLQNAHGLHPLVSKAPGSSASMHSRGALRERSQKEQAMINFVVRGEAYEQCGGLIWTWKRICDGSLFDTEGVWLCSRLLVFQFCQIVVGIIVGYAAFNVVEVVAEEADKATADLAEDFPDAPQWVFDIVPTGAETRGALYPAASVAVLVMISLILIYLPSYTKTVLMYRSGERPSLKSLYFTKYRTNVDLVYGNIGNAIYALLGSTLLFWALTALVLFLFIWDFTRGFMILVTAWGIGLTITIVIKMLLTKACRKRFFAGLYRTRPGSANLSTLALECWFIGLGGGVLIGRFTQFILAACFWVGRTDVPFLSEDVNMMGYAFDYVPTNFVKDLLVHEAHHHPYLERLLTMYLLKLKNDSFCSDAGTCWRQLFVVSFMPWMMKNRVSVDKRLTDAMDAHRKRGLELKDAARAKGFKEEIQSGLQNMADQVVDQRPSKLDDANDAE